MCTWKLHLNKIMQNQLLLLLLLLSNRIWTNILKQLPKEFSESLKIFQFIITHLVSVASNKIIFFSTFEWNLSIISSVLAYYYDNSPGASRVFPSKGPRMLYHYIKTKTKLHLYLKYTNKKGLEPPSFMLCYWGTEYNLTLKYYLQCHIMLINKI